MKRFLTRLSVFLISLMVLDRSFILFRHKETNVFAEIAREKMRLLSKEIRSDRFSKIWIVGSSHAQFGVSADVLSAVLETPAINLAYGGGANIGLQLALLKRLLREGVSSPRLIVFCIDVFTLNAKPLSSDDFQDILFGEREGLNSFSFLADFNSYAKLYGRFVPEYLKQMRGGNFSLPFFETGENYDLSMFSQYSGYEISERGWVKGRGVLNRNYVRYANMLFEPKVEAEYELDEYLEICKQRNIRVLFVQVPEHEVCGQVSQKYQDFNKWMRGYASGQGLFYRDFNALSEFPISTDELFFDSDHLNEKGGELFSLRLAECVKGYGIAFD
jgi:hypothetical protein